MSLLDKIFPVYCVNCHQRGAWLCLDCLTKTSLLRNQRCLYCHKPTVNGFTHRQCITKYSCERFFCLAPFRFPWRRAIHTLKYRPYGLAIRNALQELLIFWQTETQIEIPQEFLVVPIPLHWQKRFLRSYNQAEVIAQLVAKQYQLPVAVKALQRIKRTKTQANLPHKERVANLKDAFFVKQNEIVKGKSILLVDDVATTGATLREATRTLKKAGAKRVWCLTVLGAISPR